MSGNVEVQLGFLDIRKPEQMTKTEAEKIKDMFENGFDGFVTKMICISPKHAFFLYDSGRYTNLAYREQVLNAKKGCGWYYPEDKDICGMTKYFVPYFGNIRLKKLLMDVMYVGRRVDLWSEMDKVLDVAKPYIDIMNNNIRTKGEIIDGQSYEFGKYIVSLVAIDYSTRTSTRNLLRTVKYPDMVWKAIDGWDTDLILFTYYALPDCCDNLKRAIRSIVDTRYRGYMQIKTVYNLPDIIDRQTVEKSIREEIEKQIASGLRHIGSLPPRLKRSYDEKIKNKKLVFHKAGVNCDNSRIY